MPTQDSSGEKNSEHHLFLLLKDNEGDGGDRKGGRIKHAGGWQRGWQRLRAHLGAYHRGVCQGVWPPLPPPLKISGLTGWGLGPPLAQSCGDEADKGPVPVSGAHPAAPSCSGAALWRRRVTHAV